MLVEFLDFHGKKLDRNVPSIDKWQRIRTQNWVVAPVGKTFSDQAGYYFL
jgi:hypothetical protein